MQPKTMQVLGATLLVVGVVATGIGVAGQVGSWGATSEPANPSRTADAPSSSSTAATVAPAEDPTAFLDALGVALRDGDTDFLVARLNPAVVARYGSAQCVGALAAARDPSASFSAKTVGDPADFDWTTDGRTVSVADALTVDVDRVQRGVPGPATLHIVSVDGQFTWLVDCGTPIGP